MEFLPVQGKRLLSTLYSDVEAVYNFETHENLGPRARLGSLSLESLAMVEPGHVGAFGRRQHALVHALLHVPVPSVSMVVRTERADGYLRYFPPGVALAMDSPLETFEKLTYCGNG